MEIQMIVHVLYRKFLYFLQRALLLCIPVIVASSDCAMAGENDINTVKTAFVFNIIKFVKWDLEDPQIEVCDLVSSELGKSIKSLHGKIASGKPIKITSGLDSCNVVFVDGDTVGSVEPHSKSLVICDNGGCDDSRVMVNLVKIDNRIRFRINRAALKSAGLEVSSELLKLSI